jgi:type I restriction enzyme, S subunit
MSWESVRLKDIATIIMGQSPKSEYFNSNGEGMPFMQGKTEFGEFHPSIVKHTIKTTRVAKNNSILFTVRAPVGALNIANQDICIGRGLASINSNDGDNSFLYYLIKNHHNLFISESGEGVYDSINKTNLNNVKLFIPSNVDLRKKIGTILSAYDDLIENNLKRINLLEQAAQNIYKEWFVNMRFPGYENTPINEETGLPEGWEEKALGEFTEIKKGKNITKDTIIEGNVPVVAGGLKPAYYHNTPNTINPVITVSASGANAGFANIYLEDIWASDCSYIDVNLSDSIFFIHNLLSHQQDLIFGMQRGAAQPHVYPKDLKRAEFLIPEKGLIIKFEEQVSSQYKMKRVLLSQNQELKAARDILLPRLMNRTIEV